MNKFVRRLSSLTALSALLLAPIAMAGTHHSHHAKRTHHAVVHHASKSHHVVHHRASAKAKSKARKMSPQQRKMAMCAHQSKGMKGAAHRAFMSKCLKKKR